MEHVKNKNYDLRNRVTKFINFLKNINFFIVFFKEI